MGKNKQRKSAKASELPLSHDPAHYRALANAFIFELMRTRGVALHAFACAQHGERGKGAILATFGIDEVRAMSALPEESGGVPPGKMLLYVLRDEVAQLNEASKRALEMFDAYVPESELVFVSVFQLNDKGMSCVVPSRCGGLAARALLSSACAKCGLASAPLQRCSVCRRERYCSRECQRAHWQAHKPLCGPMLPVFRCDAHEHAAGGAPCCGETH